MLKQKITAIILCMILIFGLSQITTAAPLYAFFSGIEFYSSPEFDVVEITFDAKREINVFTLQEPDRIVIDVKYALYEGKLKTMDGGSIIKSIRYAQNSKNVVRIAMDTSGNKEHQIEQNEGIIRVFVGDKRAIDSFRERGEDIRQENMGRTSNVTRIDNLIQGTEGFKVSFDYMGSTSRVSVFTEDYKGYKIMGLTGPERLVIDIPNPSAQVQMQEIKVNTGLIKTIRFARYSQNISRIVVDLNETSSYRIEESEGELAVVFDNPGLMNLIYSSENDRVSLLIKDAMLTLGGETMKKYFTGKYSQDGLTYTLTFRSSLAKIPEGIMYVNDKYFESIEVTKTLLSLNTNIIFRAKERFEYNVMGRTSEKDTAVTVLRPANDYDLVVIDAGHGGSEPGAIYNKIMEKDINLDIALRVNEILKSRGIKTYMIRETDTYVGLYERAGIANLLNAKLFLSIHNNAMDDRSFNGTMTLYSIKNSEDKRFNSLDFSKIIHRNLLEDLKTRDRDVRKRDDLVVLRLTKMPSAMAEIAFMTNKADMDRLLTEEFKQKAADSLANSIIETLSEINQ